MSIKTYKISKALKKPLAITYYKSRIGLTGFYRRVRDRKRAEFIRRLTTDPEFALKYSQLDASTRFGKHMDLSGSNHVLEIGTGPGWYAVMLSSLGQQVTALDLKPFPTWPVIENGPSPVRFLQADATQIPLAEGSFDYCVFKGTLYYIHEDGKALAQANRILKSGGLIFLEVNNRETFYTRRTGKPFGQTQAHNYSTSEIVALLAKAGFEPIDVYTHGFWPPYQPYLWYAIQEVAMRSPSVRNALSKMTPHKYRAQIHCVARKVAHAG